MDERPKEFDERLLAYLPGLKRLARRISDEPEDLLSDTVDYALRNWASFRPDGAFWSWISLNMRSIAQRNRNRKKHNTCRVDLANHIPTPANQEHAADLARVRSLLDNRAGTCLLRNAGGELYREIGTDMGISVQRVQQLCRVARKRLLAEVA